MPLRGAGAGAGAPARAPAGSPARLPARAPALAILFVILAAALAGCTREPGQWAGIAEAWQYDDSALIEVQLHRGQPGSPASTATARAGMGEVARIEDATAELLLRDGTLQTVVLDDWRFDRENFTASAPLPATRFDGFHLNATFVLRDATTLQTSALASWHEQFRRPWQAVLDVTNRSNASVVKLSIYEVAEGARELTRDAFAPTLTPVEVERIGSWRLTVTTQDGTVREETTEPTGTRTLTVELPYTGVTQVEAYYLLALGDGTTLSDADVDNDVWPLALAQERRLEQEN